MGRSGARTLRYAVLGTLRSGPSQIWGAGASEALSDAEFDRQIREVCELAGEVRSETRQRDGARSIAATTRRIESREQRNAARNALDLQRLDDLQARYDQRRALALRQKWFVIGRVIDAAMQHDPHLRAAVLALLRTAKLRKDEWLCLGLPRT